MVGSITSPEFRHPGCFHFLTFDRCGNIAANAPMHAAIIPSMDATIVGLSSSPPEDVAVGCTVTTDEEATVVVWFVDPVDDPEEDALKGGSVPNTSVTWPGTT
jgi:hypothetical protein